MECEFIITIRNEYYVVIAKKVFHISTSPKNYFFLFRLNENPLLEIGIAPKFAITSAKCYCVIWHWATGSYEWRHETKTALSW